MSSPRTRLFQTESFRLAAIYAGLFIGSMAVLITLIYFIVAQAFEANLLRGSDDDLAAIRRAYHGELDKRPGRAVHEAKEMIDDRLIATDKDGRFSDAKGSAQARRRQSSDHDARAGSCGSRDPLPTTAASGTST